MKITLQNTEPTDDLELQYICPNVELTMPSDGLTLEEVLNHLIKPALVAHGYSPILVENITITE